VIAVVLNDEPDADEVVHPAMEEGRLRNATVRRSIGDSTAGCGVIQMFTSRSLPRARRENCENHSSAIDLAVVGSADADEIASLVAPNCHPILGYPDSSVLLVRH
jgi:hypothetical protein